MTNEEKAEQIAIKICGTPSENDITGEYPCSKEAALEMAEWKDQQFKEYLEKKLGNYAGGELVYAGIFINDIINELFGEE